MAKKIKVLECIRQGQIGGGESHLLSLVENLDRSKFEPVVLSFTSGPMIDRLREMGVESHVIYTEKPFDITKWKAVKRFLQQQQVDLIHAHGTRANSNILWAARSLHIPVIYTIHGWSFHPDQKWYVQHLRRLGEKYLVSKSTLNISVSASNQLSGKKYLKSFSSVVVNNGIDLNKFNPELTYTDIRKELGISPDVILVLFIARFTAHKQPLNLIRAFAKAVAQNKQLHLLMVGDGDEKPKAAGLIEELGITNHTTLQSFRQDVPAVLAAADIFVLPSLWEGLPIGLLEAMAMGKAVIASNVDGTSEIIQHEQNGLLIQTDQLIDNLTAALLSLSKDAEKRKALKQAALNTIGTRYNASHMTRTIEELYTSVMKKAVEQ